MSKPINTVKNFYQGGLDGDSAPPHLAANDFLVSFNCRQSGTSSGEDGYTTNIESTLLIPGTRSGGINRCIGSEGFEQIRCGIAFIYNSANYHQIVEVNYDTGVQTIVFTNLTDSAGINVLPLDPQHYVDDIYLIAETFLFFNDGFNPPFYINYVRLKAGGYGVVTANDFLLIKPQPLIPIQAVYNNDASRSVNLLVSNLFQFRSGFVFLDYEYSVLSTISERFVPATESTPSVGTDVTINNNLILSIDAGDDRVYELLVDATYGQFDWFNIKTILRSELLLLPNAIDISDEIYEAYDPGTNIYTLVFYNDGLYQNVPVLVSDQLCDTVPLKAGSAAVLNGNETILGDITIGYDRPTTEVNISATNYNPNLTVPDSGGDPLNITILNPGQSGSGLGNHKRLVQIEWGGTVRENDTTTIVLVDIRDASATLTYTFTCNSADDGNTPGFIFDNAPTIPYSSGYVPTDGNLAGLYIITPPYYTLQTAYVTIYNAGSGQFKSIHGLKSNSSYQVALAHYDKFGRPFPLETTASFVIKTDSYGQSHGLTPQINWIIQNATAPVGAVTYQWLLSENNTHQTSLYMLASLINYIGIWNASTNSPPLAGGTGTVGSCYQIGAPSNTQNLGNGAQSFDSGDFVVYNGTSWDIIPKEDGNLSSPTSYYFYLNSLAQFNAKNSTSVLNYDYTVNDRCTLAYYQTPGLGNTLNWFDGVAHPIADVQVQGYNAGTQFLKVNTSSAISPGSLAGKDILIEIYTPKQRAAQDATGATILSETAFFEIGTSYPIVNGQYTVLSGTITQGDIYFKTREIGGSIDPNVLYTPLVEDFNFSDFYPSMYTSYGRPRSYSDTLDRTEQVANMPYSEIYVVGSKVNGLTKYYAANIYGEQGGQTSSNYGRVQKMIQINNELVILQELDHGSIPVYTNILEDQVQQQNVAISEKILGNIRYTQGKHIGIGNAKQSVAVYNNIIYWIDPHRSEPIRWAGSGAVPISGKMSKYFKTTLQQAYAQGLKIIGWYDVFNDEYVISIQQEGGVVTNFPFDTSNWQWQAEYSVLPAAITISTAPTHSSADYDNTTGIVTITPDADYVGSDTLQFQFMVGGDTITKNACFNWTEGSSDVNTFGFVDVIAQALSTEIASNFISVMGNTIAADISITGGEYSINGGSWVSSAGTVNQYDTVQVRVLSSALPNTAASTTLTISATSATFTATTKQQVLVNYSLSEQMIPFIDGSLLLTANGITPSPFPILSSASGFVYVLEGDALEATAYAELSNSGTNPKLHMNIQEGGVDIFDDTIDNAPPPSISLLKDFTANLGSVYDITVTTYSDADYYSAEIDTNYRKNDCGGGETGSYVHVFLPVGSYTSAISQADADNQAQAAAQTQANTEGTCITDTYFSTLLVDYITDTTADLCAFVITPALDETNIIVTGTIESPSGPLLLPNDGTDPANCTMLSSDKLGSSSPGWRFGMNLAAFQSKYPALASIKFRIQGRNTTAKAVSLRYAPRAVSEGYFTLGGTTGARIPGVSGAATSPTTVTSNIGSGTDGTVGTGVGSPVLDLEYTFATNALVVTTY
jgi:hypothetical protein